VSWTYIHHGLNFGVDLWSGQENYPEIDLSVFSRQFQVEVNLGIFIMVEMSLKVLDQKSTVFECQFSVEIELFLFVDGVYV